MVYAKCDIHYFLTSFQSTSNYFIISSQKNLQNVFKMTSDCRREKSIRCTLACQLICLAFVNLVLYCLPVLHYFLDNGNNAYSWFRSVQVHSLETCMPGSLVISTLSSTTLKTTTSCQKTTFEVMDRTFSVNFYWSACLPMHMLQKPHPCFSRMSSSVLWHIHVSEKLICTFWPCQTSSSQSRLVLFHKYVGTSHHQGA